MAQILLIEDDAELGGQLQLAVEEAGHRCTWARRIASGRSCFDSREFDLLLLDINLPDGSGFTFLEYIRSKSQVPVIVISARLHGEDKIKALDIGADDYVTKPFWSKELTARIRAVLRRHTAKPIDSAGTYTFGEVTLDFGSRTLEVKGKDCPLTPTEFDLLEFFVRRPHQALRSERIIDSLFRNPDSANEALQTHISRLRRKVGDDSSSIQTVWGIGYRFAPPDDNID